MTVIQDNVWDIADGAISHPVRFRVPQIRGAASSPGVVTQVVHEYITDDTGQLTTDDLEPGPAKVTVAGKTYDIVIPYSVTPIRLWPLINAHLDPPPPTATGYIRNGGGVEIAQAVTAAEYAAITRDPETLYLILEDE